MSAYDTFADAANTGALKVVLEGTNVSSPAAEAERSVAVASERDREISVLP